MAERTIDIHSGLSRWLESSASALAIQADKLALFEKEAIYAEYWVQNELAFHLPWSQPGCYFVDRGAGLAIPDDKPKYPDFVLRFGIDSEHKSARSQFLYFALPDKNRRLMSAITIGDRLFFRVYNRVKQRNKFADDAFPAGHFIEFIYDTFNRDLAVCIVGVCPHCPAERTHHNGSGYAFANHVGNSNDDASVF